MRNGTLPTIAGNPPADAAQPLGMKGMIVTVITKVTVEPAAPSTPSFLFQNPRNRRVPNTYSDTPRNQLAPRMPKIGYNQKMRGPLLI
jgi:hypothetical protein